VTALPEYDSDGLDSSWDGLGEADIPDLSGLEQKHFEAAAADLGMAGPEPGAPAGAAAGDVSRAEPRLGSGKRFANLKASLAAKGAHDPGALAAYIGRKKFGKAKFQKLAAHARASSSRSDAQAFDGYLIRDFPLEDIHIVRGSAGDGRTVEAYAAVFDSETPIRDGQGYNYLEVIDRSAFNRAVDKARPQGSRNYWLTRVFYNHGMTLAGTPSERGSVPIGVTQDIRVEPRGLLTVTRYSNTPFADEILENIRNGAITAQSFTGRIVRSDPNLRRYATGQTVRRMELGLSEYGPTPIPFYADAEIVGVRAALARAGTAAPDEPDGPLPAGEDSPADPPVTDDAPAAAPAHESLARRMRAYAAAHGDWR
jgi:HK97 family phage prohead protease